MTNFREIFNPDYSQFLILIILGLVGLIFIFNRNIKESLRVTGKAILLSGIVTLVIAIIINLGINTFIPYNYKIFIQVISSSLFKNLLYSALEGIILGIALLLISKFLPQKGKNPSITSIES